MRYRYNERDVKTPTFDATEYVRFDAVPEEVEEGLSPQFDTSRQIFDANFALVPVSWGTLRLGYGHEGVERRGRGFSDVGENIFRATFDTFTSQYLTLRASYDMGWRRGEGFVETGTDYEEGPGGTQPTLRYYDESDRNRKRFSLLATVMPRDTYDVYVQFGGGWDEYFADDSVPVERPGELFGLQSADSTSWNFGINVHPNDMLAFGANYGIDSYDSFQLSRNANPPPDPTLDRSEPQLEPGRHRRDQYVQPVSRPAARRTQHRHPLRVRPQRLEQRVRARRAAHRFARRG